MKTRVHPASRVAKIKPFFVMDLLARARSLERQGMDIVHFEIGEPDFPTPPHVVEAALSFIDEGQVKYTPAAGLYELREAIAGFYLKRYGVGIAPEQIFVTPGASGGFVLAMGLLMESGAKLAMADPGYPCYANFARLFDAIPCRVPVGDACGFQLNSDLLEQYWDHETTGIVVSSPGNPTGSVLAAAVFQDLLRFAEHRGAFVISDEIYHGLEYGERACSALEFSRNAFIVNSFSKFFGMTGWRLGWLVVPPEFVTEAERMAQNIFISAPSHSQVAALAAFDSINLVELKRRRDVFRQRRDYLANALRATGFIIRARPEGAFYLYADSSRFSDDSFQLARALLEEAGVAVTPGLDFGENEPQRHLRFCYTAPMDRLAEGVRRIEEYVRGFGREVRYDES